jgi:hypothetical protein
MQKAVIFNEAKIYGKQRCTGFSREGGPPLKQRTCCLALAGLPDGRRSYGSISDATCLQFPALDAVKEGFEVHAVIDASGAVSVLEREATIATLAQAGVKVRNWWSVGAELEADWRRDEAAG